MKNNIVVILIIVLLVVAIIGLGIVLNNTKNKLDKSNNQLTLYQNTSNSMIDDAMALMKISTTELITQSQLNCLNNILGPQQLWSGLIMQSCSDNNVSSNPQGKAICFKYGDMYNNAGQTCGVK